MKKYLLVFFTVALLAFMLASCVPQQALFVSLSSSVSGKTIAPGPVTFTWKVTDLNKDATYTSNFTLTKDGTTVSGITVNGDSASVNLTENGHYIAKVVVVDSKNVSGEATYEFDVNSFKAIKFTTNSGRETLVNYTPAGTGTPEYIQVHFYYKTETATNDGSVDHPRTRIYLDGLDSGVYTKWSVAADFDHQTPLTLPATIEGIYFDYFGPSTFHSLVCENHEILAYYVDEYGYPTALKVATVGFDTFRDYQLLFNTINTDGALSSNTWKTFTLKERYDQDHYPTVFVTSDAATVAKGSTFTVEVKTKNLKEYFKNYLIDCEYMQLPLTYTASLTVENVEFYNYMPNEEDLSGYATDSSHLYIYKGFVNGTDETSKATDTVAKITFKVPSDYMGDSVSVLLNYEGFFENYDGYKDLPNPLFRDSNNRPIDGVVVNNNSATLDIK